MTDVVFTNTGFRQGWRWWLLMTHVLIPVTQLLVAVAAGACMRVSGGVKDQLRGNLNVQVQRSLI